MPQARNTSRRVNGVPSTTSFNPQGIIPDVNEKVRTLNPRETPLLTLSNQLRKGPPPKNKKIEVAQHYGFDHYDEINEKFYGQASANETRFMRIGLAQKSRPFTKSSMYYHVQDKFALPNGQVVQVVMTPTASYRTNAGELTLSTALTGNIATRSKPGTVVVRNITQAPIVPFGGNEVIYMGRSIWESQNIEGSSKIEDVIYDANFVEHFEETLEMTEDQINFIETKHGFSDFSKQQEITLQKFKQSIEYNMWFGERAIDTTIPDRPHYFMRGVLNSIKTNVTLYNPDTTDDIETLVSNFMYHQAFRYSSTGNQTKVAYVGGRFLHNFNLAFKEFRRSELSTNKQTPGLDIQTYNWMGKTLKLVWNPLFDRDSKYDNWCVVIDPMEFELRVKKNFESRPFVLPNERKKNIMIEWQGSVAVHFEESCAILRTI